MKWGVGALVLAGCDPKQPEGKFPCDTDQQCPRGWACAPDPEIGTQQQFCFAPDSPLVMDAGLSCSLDASIPSMNADGGVINTGTPMRSGGEVFTDFSANIPYDCGKWVLGHTSDKGFPPNAMIYGHEDNDMGSYDQFVCRFIDELDGKRLTLPGKGVPGFGCYAVRPTGVRDVSKVVFSDDYEVLTETQSCARMVPYKGDHRLLPTGLDENGKPIFSCHGVVNAQGLPPPHPVYPLGRFLPETGQCVFEWYTNTRIAPVLKGNDGCYVEGLEVLAIP